MVWLLSESAEGKKELRAAGVRVALDDDADGVRRPLVDAYGSRDDDGYGECTWSRAGEGGG